MKPVNLPVLKIHDRQLRFCLIDEDNCFHNSSDIHKNGCQPLFLGSDILHGTSEWDKNMSRIHARFAKHGLATKLLFKDCRIDSLKRGNEAYFYSVHGLFQAVFEYHSLPVQRQCLQHFSDVWMTAYPAESQPRLDAVYEVSMQNLVFAPGLPPRASGLSGDSETGQDKTPDVSEHPSLKRQVLATRPPEACGQEPTSENASVALTRDAVVNTSVGHPGDTTCDTVTEAGIQIQDVGTQTDDSFIAANPPWQTEVLEYVCKMCKIRTQMIEREKADIEAMSQCAKKSKLQNVKEKVPKSFGGSDPNGNTVTACVTSAENVVDDMTAGVVTVQSTLSPACLPVLCYSRSDTVINSSFQEDRGTPSMLPGVENSVAVNAFHSAIDVHVVHQQPTVIRDIPEVMDTVSPSVHHLEEDKSDFSHTVCTDTAGCVLNWIEEVSRLKMIRESEHSKSATLSAGANGEDDVNTDHAMQTTILQDIQLEMVQLVLHFLLRSLEVIASPSDVSTMSEMLTLLLNSAENSSELAAAAQEWQIASPLKLCALRVFGKWLGEEFHGFEPAISQRVTDFKQNNISNIGDLPPAADVIAELFPSCMVLFTSAWIGLTDLQIIEATEKDHSYEKCNRTLLASHHHNRNLYPLIQLVLELLNNSLVSGIAHVVYCKLRHAW